MAYIPDRGDVVWLTFSPQAGHEQAGRRPALIVSRLAYNRRVELALVCPITSQVKGYPFEVAIPSGLAVEGVILSDQIKNQDWKARQADFITKLPDHVVEEVLTKLLTLLK